MNLYLFLLYDDSFVPAIRVETWQCLRGSVSPMAKKKRTCLTRYSWELKTLLYC